MTTSDLKLMGALLKKTSWLEERQKVLAQNIANADTPGYEAQDIKPLDFKNLLEKSHAAGLTTAGSSSALDETNSAHLNASGITSSTSSKVKPSPDKKTYETSPTGNQVVLEEQLLKMNENMTDHRFTTNLYQKYMEMIKTSLKTQ